MDIKQMLEELNLKRSGLVDQLTRIDAAILALKGLNGVVETPQKALVVRRSTGSEKFSLEILSVRDFVIAYIKGKGKEVSARELFLEYYRKLGKEKMNPKERKVLYGRFYVHLAGPKSRNMGITKKTYQFEKGLGKETYFNVDSALLLQKEKSVANPNITITDVR